MSMQELLYLKENNPKFKDNFDKLNQRIDKIVANGEKKQTKMDGTFTQKRTISEILSHGETSRASKRPRKEVVTAKNYLEIFIQNPGLQHLAENIFLNLNYQDLQSCQLINRPSQLLLNNPRSQSFTSLNADLRQDINRVSSFSRCLNGTFP